MFAYHEQLLFCDGDAYYDEERNLLENIENLFLDIRKTYGLKEMTVTFLSTH